MTHKTATQYERVRVERMDDRFSCLVKAAIEELVRENAPDEQACARLYRRIFKEGGDEQNG